ncbi:MAG TPA: phosphate ABC transporter permease PstA [Thermoanaerobaculia bacterium]|nr:phosphate ABC transporter permease PstA [Thermoanaerobaculia bacterium]
MTTQPIAGETPLEVQSALRSGAGVDPHPPSPSKATHRSTSLGSRGEPFVWLTGSGLAVATVMIVSLLALVLFNGTRTFWPKRIVEITLTDGKTLLGEVTRAERFRVDESALAEMPPQVRADVLKQNGWATRRLIRTGNYDLYGEDFVWVPAYAIARERRPADAWLFERREWGTAIGRPEALLNGETAVANGAPAVAQQFAQAHAAATARWEQVRALEKGDVGDINHAMEAARLSVKRAAMEHGEGSPEHQRAAAAVAAQEESLTASYEALQKRIDAIRAEDAQSRLRVTEVGGRLLSEKPSDAETPMLLSQIVRAYPANTVGTWERLKIYVSRWREFLVSEPREANTEGGVWPAIFGTFLMTVIMSLAVAPLGVITALYLREYAKQGPLVSAVRIAVNNLAGVPSIVFGVFGLGFFCYVVGARIDQLFYPEKLPAPTYGTGGILWASLTLALLTVPVVIVATEEALAAVPRSMREGSFACGASRWQTIRRIVLPKATPGIMTGLILAMARGAGEVAPLMITGVVKLAPELPFDSHFPFFHLERSFMHLGFHIYDVGFQSRNSEAGKPMVFTTTLLLIGLIALLNFTAIRLRNRLRRRYRSADF